MTFLEAAIQLLEQAGRPMHFKELAERAVQKGLLEHVGRTPELTMQARLAQATKKGSTSRIIRVKPGVFGLRSYEHRGEEPATPRAAKPRETKSRSAAGRTAEVPAGRTADRSTSRPAAVASEATPAAPVAEAPAETNTKAGQEAASGDTETAAGKRRRRRRGRGRGRAEAEGITAEAQPAQPGAEAAVAEAQPAQPGAEAAVAEAQPARPEAEAAAPVATREPGHHEAAPATRASAAGPEIAELGQLPSRPRVASVPEAGTLPARPVDPTSPVPMADVPSIGDVPPVTTLVPMADEVSAAGVETAAPAATLDPEIEALAREYADELGGAVSLAFHGEVVDEHTADEDRPMLEEIQSDRGRDRRDRRRRGRDRKEKGREAARGRERAPEAKPRPEAQGRPGQASTPPVVQAAPRPATAKAAQPVGQEEAAAAKVPAAGEATASLADVACQLLRSLSDPRPVHARQLAAMALKRRFATGELESLWRDIQLALFEDSRARLAGGLRPRVRFHGGSLFTLQALRLDPDVVRAEEELARRATVLTDETRRALRRRLGRLPLPAFERAIRLWLERTGVTGVERVKQVNSTVYLVGKMLRGGLGNRVLIAARAGDGDLDRRAVGELRAGVVAKQLDGAMLLGAGGLGQDVEKEIRKPGPPVTVYDGDALAEALMGAGVGALRAALPVVYLDIDLLSELGEP